MNDFDFGDSKINAAGGFDFNFGDDGHKKQNVEKKVVPASSDNEINLLDLDFNAGSTINAQPDFMNDKPQ